MIVLNLLLFEESLFAFECGCVIPSILTFSFELFQSLLDTFHLSIDDSVSVLLLLMRNGGTSLSGIYAILSLQDNPVLHLSLFLIAVERTK